MDLTATYCPTRRDLEENGWSLTSRLTLQTKRLMRLIGQDRRVFQEMRDDCQAIRLEISDSHRELREHRLAHGC